MGGNVFAGASAPIKKEHIDNTLANYFKELDRIFPRIRIFGKHYFNPLGSTYQKDVSGDIDLGIDSTAIAPFRDNSDLLYWGIDEEEFNAEFKLLSSRAKTSTESQLKQKALLKLIAKKINLSSPVIMCDTKKINDGNLFTLAPQINETGKPTGEMVQIDWMVGNLGWLRFSYYSASYPPESNVKGLHRTQLLLSAFQIANLSFTHVNGIKDKETGKILTEYSRDAINILNDRLNIGLDMEHVYDFYMLHNQLKQQLSPENYGKLLDIYFKILDSTRTDIPDILQDEWLQRKDKLSLTGKFLPDNSKLKEYI